MIIHAVVETYQKLSLSLPLKISATESESYLIQNRDQCSFISVAERHQRQFIITPNSNEAFPTTCLYLLHQGLVEDSSSSSNSTRRILPALSGAACTMDTCFDAARCADGPLFYIYPGDLTATCKVTHHKHHWPAQCMLQTITKQFPTTTDPDKACFFIPGFDTGKPVSIFLVLPVVRLCMRTSFCIRGAVRLFSRSKPFVCRKLHTDLASSIQRD